jgi:hypothetical protein
MAINLSDNILAKTTAPGDAKYGPYTGVNLSAALSAATTYLLASYRYEGLTIGIIVNTDPIVEYWFYGGIADGDLVLKSSGGGSAGSAGTSGSSGTSGTSGINGSSGTSGSSGSSGSSGTSGTGFNTVQNPADYRILTATGSSTNQAYAWSTLTYDGNILTNDGSFSRILNGGGAWGNTIPQSLYDTFIVNGSETDFVGLGSRTVAGSDNNTPSIIFGDNPNGTNDLLFTYISYATGPIWTPTDLMKLTYDGQLHLFVTPSNISSNQFLVRDSITGVIG